MPPADAPAEPAGVARRPAAVPPGAVERPAEPWHDVVIIGAGAVGLTLACLLARRGIDVVVLERRTDRGTHSRAIGIHPPGLRALAAAGIEGEVRRRAVEIHGGRVTCEGRVLGSLAFTGIGTVLSLPQLETEALLERRLEVLRPGCLRRGVVVDGLRDRGTHVEVTGAVDGVPVTVLARYAVGADGVRSGIRNLLGIDWVPQHGRAQYVMCDTRDETGEPEHALLHFEPAGVVESFPLPGGRRRWVAWVRRAPATATAEQVATIVAERTGAGFDTLAASGPSTFEARQHLARRMSQGRVALAGDAGHEISPIGGQGMNLGWLDALRLDHDLAVALATGTPAAPFERYDRARRAAAARAARQAAFNMRMGAPAAGIRLRLRNAAVRALAIPPVRTLLARAFTMRWL